MTRPYRAFIRKPRLPLCPAFKKVSEWAPINRGFYAGFRDWLYESGYGPSSLNLYGVATRLALSLHNKPYWTIDPEADLRSVREFILDYYTSESTVQSYFKGIAKLEQYLRLRCHKPKPEKAIHWPTYVGSLPTWIVEHIQVFFEHRRRTWPVERRYELAHDFLSSLTRPLRGMAALCALNSLTDLTPQVWYAYVDRRLQDGIGPVTLNGELSCFRHWLLWLKEQGEATCERLFKVGPLAEGPRLPKDAPVEHLRQLLDAIERDAASTHSNARRMGVMDRAWFLLMLHSGLRVGEIRRMKLAEIDWEKRRLRIEQSKGLKDRLVPLSQATLSALRQYLQIRGPQDALPEQVFIFQHRPLSESYCYERLQTYGKRCGVKVTPHQLRHSCATLLLNAGAPVLTVQTVLGHKHVHTTLGYARLYDGTVAADYYRAMAQVEQRLALPEDAAKAPPTPAELVALVDALRRGTLNDQQAETVAVLRAGLLAMAEQAAPNN